MDKERMDAIDFVITFLVELEKSLDAQCERLEEFRASMGTSPVDELLKLIESKIQHEMSQTSRTDYQRGWVAGLRWAKTEIMKTFGR